VSVLLTIGYEGTTPDEFVAALKAAEAEVVIDVREVAASRKRGFSKNALADALAAAGIGYVHLRDLGTPKPGREAARSGDRDTFERIFRTHLSGDPAQQALTEAVDIAAERRACLVCLERDHARCHRSIVAEAMGERADFQVRHLTAD
jgi:uncharacterized protein (DUF488 family)